MLEDPPLLTIRREWARPHPDLLKRLAGVQTGQAIDAMDGRGALPAAIKPLDPSNARFIGTALPCETGPNDNLAILGAMATARPGDVIISASEGFSHSAVVGDNIALVCKAKGVAAIVVDGMMRDLDGLLPVGLPLFARGLTPNSCVRSGPGRVGLPVAIGGVAVQAGDVILGDRDGVVVLPHGDLAAILARIDKVRAAEAAMQDDIRRGFTDLGGMEALLSSARVRFVE